MSERQFGVILHQPVGYSASKFGFRCSLSFESLLFLSVLQDDSILKLFTCHHLPQVDQPVPHPAQGRINAATCNFCNFFKAKVGKMS